MIVDGRLLVNKDVGSLKASAYVLDNNMLVLTIKNRAGAGFMKVYSVDPQTPLTEQAYRSLDLLAEEIKSVYLSWPTINLQEEIT